MRIVGKILLFTDNERYRKINKRSVHYCFNPRKRSFLYVVVVVVVVVVINSPNIGTPRIEWNKVKC